MTSDDQQSIHIKQFEGLRLEPRSNTVVLEYRSSQRPEVVCQMTFSIETSSLLAAWLVELYERLTGDPSMGVRLKAMKLRGDTPKGST